MKNPPDYVNHPLTVSTRVLNQELARALTEKVHNPYPKENMPEPEVIELVKVIETFRNEYLSEGLVKSI